MSRLRKAIPRLPVFKEAKAEDPKDLIDQNNPVVQVSPVGDQHLNRK